MEEKKIEIWVWVADDLSNGRTGERIGFLEYILLKLLGYIEVEDFNLVSKYELTKMIRSGLVKW